MSKTLITIAIILTTAAVRFTSAASSLAAMSPSEIRTLLAEAPVSSEDATDLSSQESTEATGPVDVTAHDLMTKVYGLLDDRCTRGECVRAAHSRLSMDPEQEEDRMWLDSDRGYRLRYDGMTPDISAMARFAPNDSVAEYCYFFLFPYRALDARGTGLNDEQADFTGRLLQEMSDLDMEVDNNSMTDDLFDVYGDYATRLVNVRLIDDPGRGRYILMMTVEPDAFTDADNVAAL